MINTPHACTVFLKLTFDSGVDDFATSCMIFWDSVKCEQPKEIEYSL